MLHGNGPEYLSTANSNDRLGFPIPHSQQAYLFKNIVYVSLTTTGFFSKRKDEEPNIKLAEVIVASNNKAAIKELIHCLHHQNKGIRHDCIKVLYEIGNRKPVLIAAYVEKSWNS